MKYKIITRVLPQLDGTYKFLVLPGQGDNTSLNTTIFSNQLIYDPAKVDLKLYADDDKPVTLHLEVNKDGKIVTVAGKHEDKLIPTDVLELNRKHNMDVFAKSRNEAILTHPYPEIPDDLYIDKLLWRLIMSAIELGLYPLLLGPKGTGKTSTARAISDALNADYFPINCGSIFKPKNQLVGSMQAKDGSTFRVDSEFLRYFKGSDDPNKKTIIFLNEISRIPSQASNMLLVAVDQTEGQGYIYDEDEGKRIYKGENVIFIADGNYGAEYTDTRQTDGALDDRFQKFFLDYLPESEEVKLVAHKLSKFKGAKVSAEQIREVVGVANTIRTGVKQGDIITTMSTRKVIDVCKYLLHGFTVQELKDTVIRNLFVQNDTELEFYTQAINATS